MRRDLMNVLESGPFLFEAWGVVFLLRIKANFRSERNQIQLFR